MLLFSQKPWHEQVLRTTNIEELNYRQKELSIRIKGGILPSLQERNSEDPAARLHPLEASPVFFPPCPAGENGSKPSKHRLTVLLAGIGPRGGG